MRHVFGIATGWLGWSPEQAWNSTIPEIDAAVDGRIEWVRMTTPGAKKQEEPKNFGEFISTVKALPGTKVYGK